MNGMTTHERYADICKISGMSEDIVRRVLAAEKESICKSLKKGERATLIGRVTIVPEIRSKVGLGGEIKNCIKLRASVSSSLATELEELSQFDSSDDAEDIDLQEEAGIVLHQIPSLI